MPQVTRDRGSIVISRSDLRLIVVSNIILIISWPNILDLSLMLIDQSMCFTYYEYYNLFSQSIFWDNDVKTTKYTLKEMIVHHSSLELPEGKAINKCETLADLA